MPGVIETPRLILCPPEPGDLDALHALVTDPGVRRYLFDDQIVEREVVGGIIERSQAQHRDEGHGLWLAHLRQGGQLAGFTGFWYFRDPPELELLYALAPANWGKGLATELATAMLRHGFETLGFASITGSTDAPNTASCRVMERAGMTLTRRATIDSKPTVFYTIKNPHQSP